MTMSQVLTDAKFSEDVLKSEVPVMVDFWAEWCGPCHAIAPTIEELATEYAGKLKVGKMDVDQNPTTPGQYNIMSIPTTMIFKGGQPVKSLVGAQAKDVFKREIEEVLAS